MTAENNYEEILEEVSEKLNKIDSVKEIDVLSIKNSVESIENLITDTQAKLNFEEIKEKLENIAVQVDGCNDVNVKNLEEQISGLHKAMTGYLEQIVSNFKPAPQLEEISSVVSDINSLALKDIKTTNTLVKDLQTKISKLDSNFESKDFEKQIVKISEIYDSLGIINDWIEKVGYINQSIENVYARLGESIDFDDVAEKVDIIYENISALNNWTRKIDNVDSSMSGMQSKIASLSDFIDDTKNISDSINVIKNSLDTSTITDVDFDDIANKMDIVYENLTAINEWASKVDDISQTSGNLNSKIDEMTQALSEASKAIEYVPNLKEKLENLSEELHAITSTTKNDAESYIYTLLDIESDFLKLHKFVDDKTKVTSEDIHSLKEKFAELNNDISSISIRTNRLILSADDTNKEFKTYLEEFKSTIKDIEEKNKEYNPELKFTIIGEKISEMLDLLNNSLNATKNLNDAFAFLAEWVDATGIVLNTMQNDIKELKNKNANETTVNSGNNLFADNEVEGSLKNEVTTLLKKVEEVQKVSTEYNNTDEIAEIKSLLTGVIVQLNTALTPDIDSLNERIDKLSEENSKQFSELETLMQEKIEYQAKHITSLEEKIDALESKFDKLIEAVGDNKNYEIKDILNYIATQVASANENISSQKSNEVLNQVAEKLESFDSNINKLVSYIEED